MKKNLYKITYTREGVADIMHMLARDFDFAVDAFAYKTKDWKDVELLSVELLVAGLSID